MESPGATLQYHLRRAAHQAHTSFGWGSSGCDVIGSAEAQSAGLNKGRKSIDPECLVHAVVDGKAKVGFLDLEMPLLAGCWHNATSENALHP